MKCEGKGADEPADKRTLFPKEKKRPQQEGHRGRNERTRTYGREEGALGRYTDTHQPMGNAKRSRLRVMVGTAKEHKSKSEHQEGGGGGGGA